MKKLFYFSVLSLSGFSLAGCQSTMNELKSSVESVSSQLANVSLDDSSDKGKDLRGGATPISESVLKDIFKDKPYSPNQSKLYPRIAITVHESPDFHNVVYPIGTLEDRQGCYKLSAKVWHSYRKSEDVNNISWCVSDYISWGKPGSYAKDWSRLNNSDYVKTLSKRTMGPNIPRTVFPTDMDHINYWKDRNPMDKTSYDNSMIFDVLNHMSFDYSNNADRRVWFYSFNVK